ncbi:MAG: hypothetical protein E4G96_00880 [Chrysiogenales bacterium]|nr:MAG: hypothetical protein E4G96_00880 [Chrysiogenales bacterium]
MKTLAELLQAITMEIRKKHTGRSLQSLPLSDEFPQWIAERYSLLPFATHTLFKILADSHLIFIIPVVEADRKERIRRVEGYVVAEGNIIKSMVEFFGDELIRAYSTEFSMKYSVERITKEFFPRLKEYNNTELGKIANILINLMGCQMTLGRNIMQYGQKWQEKQLGEEIEASAPLESFIDSGNGGLGREKGSPSKPAAPDSSRRATDAVRIEEFNKYSSGNTIEKTIAVYGIEFYSRVFFREYRFTLLKKLIEEDRITKNEDLRVVKKILQKTRSNSDQDFKLQAFAHDINSLEKSINEKLKKG